MNKGYIVYLPKYENSVNMAIRALETGRFHGWNVSLFPGVDGTLEKLQDHNLFP